jgi:hypothetical protein
MSRENYDNYDQEDFTYHAADHSASDSINSETMEKKDSAINQHEDESQRHNYSEDHFERDNDDKDDNFLDNDANRRTLDEEKADEDEE